MKNIFAFLIYLITFSVLAKSKVEIIKIKNIKYEVINTSSILSGRAAPLLVIAPAKKYTMTGEIFENIAERASKLGFHVVSFNWSFITNKKDASTDLKKESEDLINIISYYKKEPYIDSLNITLVAKSFGSRVAMLGGYKEAQSVLLLTPNCDKKNTFFKTYEPVLKTSKNIHILISKDDPYCDVNQIHYSMKELKKDNITIHTLYGDHNFKLQNKKSLLNEKAAIDSAINWLNNQINL